MQTLARHTSDPPPAEEALEFDRRIESLLRGQEEAWPDLVAELHPLAVRLCRLRLRSRTESSDDICRDVATKTLERLKRSGYAALRRYSETREKYPDLGFESWLRVVVGNVCIDHLRSLPGHQRVRDGKERRHVTKKQVALSSEPAGPDDIRRHVEIRRVLTWLSDPAFPNDQREALALWMRGHNAAEIAEVLGLPMAADATRLLRAGRQRLRRRFEDE
jgi:RNA polymerase sigma factor (sigma-70 family)